MPNKYQSIFLGGAITGALIPLIGLVPVVGGCISCLGYSIAGIVAVWHFTSTHELTIEGGTGAGMGALAGIVTAIVGSVVSYVLIELGLAPGTDQIVQDLADSGAFEDEMLDSIAGFFESPLSYLLFIGVGCLLGAILGAVGGAIGASMFKKGGEFPA
ncbi:MAG: hypothetical protein AB8G77_04495 [Rhodothermales bacterium]